MGESGLLFRQGFSGFRPEASEYPNAYDDSMTSAPYRYWLARDGQVHGPYDVPYLLELNAASELMPGDGFCAEGTETWLTLEEWQSRFATAEAPPAKPRQTVIRKKTVISSDPSRNTQQTKPTKQPVFIATLPSARKAPRPATEGGASTAGPSDPSKRLSRLVEGLNDHRRAHPHRHPFYFAQPDQIAEVVAWLDRDHGGWDGPLAYGGATALAGVLDEWLIPAVAYVKADLVKPSHRADFGDGRPWRSFEETQGNAF
jgi:hypothetical protein